MSRPHCELAVQALAPGGSGRQAAATQYSPPWQSVFFAQAPEQTPPVQASSDLQSLASLHLGMVEHFPALQAQDEAQSEVSEQEEPGQPKVQSSQGPDLSMMQPARSSGVSSRAKREFICLVERGEGFWSALDSLGCPPFKG